MNLNEQKELPLNVSGPCGLLEAKITGANPGGALAAMNLLAIVCHPHPLQGGTMDNKVVTTLVRTYRELGIGVVRFNFRGVGASEGKFDMGVGEVEDLRAVVDRIAGDFPLANLMLAGFSFGSSVAAQASYHVDRLCHLLLLAPPVERYAYDRERRFPCPVCVVQGGKDEQVIAEGVYEWAKSLKSPVTLLRYEEVGHFFHGHLTRLKQDLSAIIQDQLT